MRRIALVAAVALFTLTISLLLVVSPKFNLGNTSNIGLATFIPDKSISDGSIEHGQRIAELEAEVRSLKASLDEAHVKMKSAGVNIELASSNSLSLGTKREEYRVDIDLLKLLGTEKFFAGISWDPLYCMPSYRSIWPNLTDEFLNDSISKITKELRTELADVHGLKAEDVNADLMYDEQPWYKDTNMYATDSRLSEWRSRILVVMSKWMPRGDRRMYLQCQRIKDKEVFPEQLGTKAVDCTDVISGKALAEVLGYYPMPWESPYLIAKNYVEVGTCSSHVRNHKTSWGQWLRTERFFNSSWMTFPVATPEEDAVVMLFDVLYEKLTVFTKQYWLGVITMQNPFDMYSIQDIIFTTRPTLLIETGTANGGSALLWASILNLSDLDDSKIITLDVYEPKWEEGQHTWGGQARMDPTKHRLWKKHVQFIKGNSVGEEVVQKVKNEAKGQKVMVLLDSHHTEYHVIEEMEAYCPLVSVGYYCIVEDTKMSRWSSTGPLEAVVRFLANHPEFILDRGRELLYSHHSKGYLKRIR
ncbi:hypothetical protein CEUSTIGMA_g989.t1 [Chlamydomonas eustigma]|uniref:Rhamnosyl O-methyltransferase n=1 Tax=Chlamydomonas eustigma TaxID=1157962 RepID=A0A250WRS8_9CHLO|nr:hypothetical protein CEUSTIGMA_g989.t1 [Chlamydomonas eustigma]|eukprot:GAX73538.1 hypothetical protein CEUSTIGMA_g989.t1 [Chlamydomonas eustigma]